MPATASVSVNSAWSEVTAALNMTDGTTYVVEFVSNDRNAVLEAIDSTEETTPPDGTVQGARLYPGSPRRQSDAGTFEKESGSYYWVRVINGSGHFVATET